MSVCSVTLVETVGFVMMLPLQRTDGLLCLRRDRRERGHVPVIDGLIYRQKTKAKSLKGEEDVECEMYLR